jgi:hypothetical protein
MEAAKIFVKESYVTPGSINYLNKNFVIPKTMLFVNSVVLEIKQVEELKVDEINEIGNKMRNIDFITAGVKSMVLYNKRYPKLWYNEAQR